MTLTEEPKTPKIEQIAVDFDERHRILHVASRVIIHPASPEHLDIVFAAFKRMLDKFTAAGRVYLIIDMSNIIIEPELRALYSDHVRDIYQKYVYPHGVARYGYQITRITVRSGHGTYLKENPNIFNSRDEAEKYIHSIIKRLQSS